MPPKDKDIQIKKDLHYAYTLTVEHARKADKLEKNLVLMIGDSHTSRHALAIELMIAFAFCDLGIPRAAVECDQPELEDFKKATEEVLSYLLPGFNCAKPSERKRAMKKLPSVFNEYSQLDDGAENANYLWFLQLLDDAEVHAFDPHFRINDGDNAPNMTDANFMLREYEMLRSLRELATKGGFYGAVGRGHLPILIQGLKEDGNLLVVSIHCENIREKGRPEDMERFRQAEALATWSPPICKVLERYTASQVMDIVLEVLPEARKRHNLFPRAPRKITFEI